MRGFTLLELMCVLVVISILSVVALPLYRHESRVASRAQGIAALLEVSARQQEFFAEHRRYADALQELGFGHASFAIDRQGKERPPDSAARIYIISLATRNGSFVVTAQPALGQKEDIGCGALSLSASGAASVTGGHGVRQCWR